MSNPDPQTFAVRSEATGTTFVVEVAGEVDMATAPGLRQALERTPEGIELVVIDLSAVSFLDSSGLNALVQGRRALAEHNVSVCVVVPVEAEIRRVFEITRLTEPLTVVAARPSAAD